MPHLPAAGVVRRAIKVLLLAAVAVPLAGAAGDPPADTVIKGGTIYSGGQGAPFVGDVAIRDDRIVYVGPSKQIAAARTIDATGKIVAPGFIDGHTHPDTYIRAADPAVRVNAAWLTQGVSTVVIGVDGYGTTDIARDTGKLVASSILRLPPSTDQRGSIDASRLDPDASHGYWSAVTSIPLARAALISAITDPAVPCTSTPSALMCAKCTGMPASRPIRIASRTDPTRPMV